MSDYFCFLCQYHFAVEPYAPSSTSCPYQYKSAKPRELKKKQCNFGNRQSLDRIIFLIIYSAKVSNINATAKPRVDQPVK